VPLADRKKDRATISPVNCWTFFTLVGLLIPMIAAHLSGFASMPLLVKRKPRNLLASTPNTHLSGLSFKFYMAIVVNSSSSRQYFNPYFST